MEITRDVILDLLPMYIADEVSEETRLLIEEYLETDPELAKIAKRSKAMKFGEDVPTPLTKDDNLKAFRKAKWLLFLFIISIAMLLSMAGVIAMFWAFFTPSS
jgi:hypothetical protein